VYLTVIALFLPLLVQEIVLFNAGRWAG
jgi:hypothetical protein